MFFLTPRHLPSFSAAELAESLVPGGAGDAIERFEERFARYVGVDHAVFVSKGRVGLYLVLQALGLAGHEVAVPAFNCLVVPNTVHYVGGANRFIDIGVMDYDLDVERLKKKITDKTRAVIPTHLYGLPCDMDAVGDVAEKNGLVVIEDAAQALGADIGGAKAGGLGDVGFFSFDLFKSFSTVDGGMVTMNDGALADHVRRLRDGLASPSRTQQLASIARGTAGVGLQHRLGYKALYEAVTRGRRYMPSLGPGGISPGEKSGFTLPAVYGQRPAAWQARLGLSQLGRLDDIVAARRRNAEQYTRLLSDIEGLVLPRESEGVRHSFCRYTVRCPAVSRHVVVESLFDSGVDVGVWFPYVVHENPALARELGYGGECPHAEQAAREVFDLPVYPGLSGEEITAVAEAVREAVAPYSG